MPQRKDGRTMMHRRVTGLTDCEERLLAALYTAPELAPLVSQVAKVTRLNVRSVRRLAARLPRLVTVHRISVHRRAHDWLRLELTREGGTVCAGLAGLRAPTGSSHHRAA